LRLACAASGCRVVAITSRKEAGWRCATCFPSARQGGAEVVDPVDAPLNPATCVFLQRPTALPCSKRANCSTPVCASSTWRRIFASRMGVWESGMHAACLPRLDAEACMACPSLTRAIRKARLIAIPAVSDCGAVGLPPFDRAGVVEPSVIWWRIAVGVSGAGRQG